MQTNFASPISPPHDRLERNTIFFAGITINLRLDQEENTQCGELCRRAVVPTKQCSLSVEGFRTNVCSERCKSTLVALNLSHQLGFVLSNRSLPDQGFSVSSLKTGNHLEDVGPIRDSGSPRGVPRGTALNVVQDANTSIF